jgi:hypothetical protein
VRPTLAADVASAAMTLLEHLARCLVFSPEDCKSHVRWRMIAWLYSLIHIFDTCFEEGSG